MNNMKNLAVILARAMLLAVCGIVSSVSGTVAGSKAGVVGQMVNPAPESKV